MNNYHLTNEQQLIVSKAINIANDTCAEHAAEVDSEGRFPSESLSALAKNGFYGLTIPEQYGGMGQSLRVAAAVIDEISQTCASTAMIYLMHLCGVSAYLSAAEKTSAQLKSAAEGKHLATLAWSERGSRSHFWAPMNQETDDGDFILLNGMKSWVTSAGVANGYVATTRAAGSDNPMAITLYLIKDEDTGLNIEAPWNGLGMRGNMSAPMVMENLKLSKSRAITEPGKAMDTMMGVVLPVFALGNAAVSVGTCEAAISATQKHLVGSKLEHLGQRLCDLPNLRERLAKMRIRTDQARSHLVATLDAIESSDPATMLWVLQSKAQAGEAALEVTDLGMRACGGAAFSKHLGLERIFRDARAMSVMAPTTDVLHDFIGKALCGMELF